MLHVVLTNKNVAVFKSSIELHLWKMKAFFFAIDLDLDDVMFCILPLAIAAS